MELTWSGNIGGTLTAMKNKKYAQPAMKWNQWTT